MMRKLVILGILTVFVLSFSVSAQVSFKDVPDNHWAADAVYDLLKLGVTKGYPDGTFRGNKMISRYETAAFLSKLAMAIKAAPAPAGISAAEVKKIVKDEIAAQKTEKVGAAVSGVVYFGWMKGLENTSFPNSFDISRVYLNVENDLGANAKAKVTYDVNTSRPNNTLDGYLKYAYVDLLDVLPAGGQATVNARVGLLPTYWVGYVDNILGIRYISANLTNRNSVLSSADFGVGANGSVDLAGLEVKFDGAVINGAGFKSAETNSGKHVNLRVNSEIIEGIEVALGGQVEDVDSSGNGAKLANGLVAYKASGVKAYGEIFYGKGAQGGTIAAICDLDQVALPGYKIFGRYDLYDPSRSVENDQKTTMILGGSYDWNKNVAIALDYIADTYGSAAATNAGQTVSTANIHTQIKF